MLGRILLVGVALSVRCLAEREIHQHQGLQSVSLLQEPDNPQGTEQEGRNDQGEPGGLQAGREGRNQQQRVSPDAEDIFSAFFDSYFPDEGSEGGGEGGGGTLPQSSSDQGLNNHQEENESSRIAQYPHLFQYPELTSATQPPSPPPPPPPSLPPQHYQHHQQQPPPALLQGPIHLSRPPPPPPPPPPPHVTTHAPPGVFVTRTDESHDFHEDLKPFPNDRYSSPGQNPHSISLGAPRAENSTRINVQNLATGVLSPETLSENELLIRLPHGGLPRHPSLENAQLLKLPLKDSNLNIFPDNLSENVHLLRLQPEGSNRHSSPEPSLEIAHLSRLSPRGSNRHSSPETSLENAHVLRLPPRDSNRHISPETSSENVHTLRLKPGGSNRHSSPQTLSENVHLPRLPYGVANPHPSPETSSLLTHPQRLPPRNSSQIAPPKTSSKNHSNPTGLPSRYLDPPLKASPPRDSTVSQSHDNHDSDGVSNYQAERFRLLIPYILRQLGLPESLSTFILSNEEQLQTFLLYVFQEDNIDQIKKIVSRFDLSYLKENGFNILDTSSIRKMLKGVDSSELLKVLQGMGLDSSYLKAILLRTGAASPFNRQDGPDDSKQLFLPILDASTTNSVQLAGVGVLMLTLLAAYFAYYEADAAIRRWSEQGFTTIDQVLRLGDQTRKWEAPTPHLRKGPVHPQQHRYRQGRPPPGGRRRQRPAGRRPGAQRRTAAQRKPVKPIVLGRHKRPYAQVGEPSWDRHYTVEEPQENLYAAGEKPEPKDRPPLAEPYEYYRPSPLPLQTPYPFITHGPSSSPSAIADYTFYNPSGSSSPEASPPATPRPSDQPTATTRRSSYHRKPVYETLSRQRPTSPEPKIITAPGSSWTSVTGVPRIKTRPTSKYATTSPPKRWSGSSESVELEKNHRVRGRPSNDPSPAGVQDLPETPVNVRSSNKFPRPSKADAVAPVPAEKPRPTSKYSNPFSKDDPVTPASDETRVTSKYSRIISKNKTAEAARPTSVVSMSRFKGDPVTSDENSRSTDEDKKPSTTKDDPVTQSPEDEVPTISKGEDTKPPPEKEKPLEDFSVDNFFNFDFGKTTS